MRSLSLAYYTGFALSTANEVDRWLRVLPLLVKESAYIHTLRGVKLPSNLYLIFAASWVPTLGVSSIPRQRVSCKSFLKSLLVKGVTFIS